ncbi:encapsulin [candidate division WOR-3 bacterium]|nr:encapsulin [candidate division WOR-3 bacterium]
MSNALKNLGKAWDAAIVAVLGEQTIGRKLIPKNEVLSGKGIGMTSVETRAYTARSDAVINYDIQEDLEDAVDITSKTLKIPVQQDDARIKRRDWEAYKLAGVNIDNDIAIDMAANVAEKEDEMIIDGWKPDGTNYYVKGMYQVANNAYNGADFGTVGSALAAVANAIALLRADKIYSMGWNLVLNPVQYGELEASYSSTMGLEYEQVLKMLNRNAPGNPGRIYESSSLADGEGMVAPVATAANKRFFDLVIAQEPKHDIWYETSEDSGPIRARLLGALVPRFKHLDSSDLDNCICQLNTI